MKIKEIHNVYFLGIGGIGMSAIARWFNKNQVNVHGYDKTPSPLTDELIREGIKITFEDKKEELSPDFLKPKSDNLIIYTPAIPSHSVLLNYFKSEGFTPLKRSEVLGLITKDYFTIAVAGTHGKTTTSSMISHILKSSGRNVIAFVGGILQNYQSNLLLNDTDSKEEPIVVVEADEFDRSFHRLSPDIVVLTTVDPDHLDIYNNPEEFDEGFKLFLQKLPSKGELIVNECVKKSIYKDLKIKVATYGVDSLNDYSFEIQKSSANLEQFTDQTKTQYQLGISGIHNVHNALGSIIASKSINIEIAEIKKALKSYKGVKRRFEFIVDRKDIVFIDDYAHHPSELEALIDSVKEIYPGKKISMIFQPHLFSRTNDFMTGFAEQLSRVDQLFLLEIYPARELPMEGVTSQVLLDKIDLENKVLISKEDLLQKLSDSKLEILLTVGAGDIDRLVQPIRNLIELDQLIA